MVTPKAEHGEIFIVCQYIVILHHPVRILSLEGSYEDISIRIWF